MKATIQGSGRVDSQPEFMNSTRTKRAGFIRPLLNSLHIAQEFEVTKSTMHMHVGNMRFYRKGNAQKMGDAAFRHIISDYNLKLHKSFLEHKLKINHNMKVVFHHVKAHQDTTLLKDKNGEEIPLTTAVKLNNIICNKMAEEEIIIPTPGYGPKLNPEISLNTKIVLSPK